MIKVLISISSFFIIILLHQAHFLNNLNDNKKQLFFAPPEILNHFLLGYKEVYADLLWVRVLQDFGVCEQNYRPENGARIGKNRIANCNLGWSYHMLNQILDLTPRYLYLHRMAPMVLSILADDIAGATNLFLKALARFPNDQVILFRAGYHFMFELEEVALAAQYYLRAVQNGANPALYALVSKVYSDVGRYEIARDTLEAYISDVPNDKKLLEEAQARLREIEERIKAQKQRAVGK